MRLCFLVSSLAPSGGTAVIVQHARRLLESQRFTPELVLTTRQEQPMPDTGGVPVRRLQDVLDQPYDIAVATWWETAECLYAVRANRRCVYLQSIENRFYEERDLFERLGASVVLGLPVDFVVVAGWMRDLLADLRPEARCHVVVNGVDKATFRPRRHPPPPGKLRVLVEGQPGLWFKGVQDAVGAVRGMREPVHLTVACLDPRGAQGIDADRVVGGLTPDGMASLYAESDVLVKLSRVEGLGLPPLEAFHVGLPCVLAPYTGHDEYARHGKNALLTGFDDEPGTAAALDLLARDRRLLARLGDGALDTAAEWPSAVESSRRMASALDAIAQDFRADEAEGLSHLHRTLAFHAEVGRHRIGAGEWACDRVPELTASRDECAQLLFEAETKIEEITRSRGYRAMVTARSLLNRIRP